MIGSTFGNDLAPTSNGIEVIFSIINVLSGLMLFTLLIGNIQVKTVSHRITIHNASLTLTTTD